MLLISTLSLVVPTAQHSSADVFQIDPAHSSVVFRIKHTELNHIYGMFTDVSGQFTVDGKGGFDITANVESINTGNQGRDRHLKSPDFFSARQFPEIQFKSDKVKRIDDATLEANGALTLRGVTKPITARITTATGSGRQGEVRAGIETTIKVKRSDFKLGNPTGLGDDVIVVISLQGVEQ
jgi:polyisoprenoid-binding protein YceI